MEGESRGAGGGRTALQTAHWCLYPGPCPLKAGPGSYPGHAPRPAGEGGCGSNPGGIQGLCELLRPGASSAAKGARCMSSPPPSKLQAPAAPVLPACKRSETPGGPRKFRSHTCSIHCPTQNRYARHGVGTNPRERGLGKERMKMLKHLCQVTSPTATSCTLRHFQEKLSLRP